MNVWLKKYWILQILSFLTTKINQSNLDYSKPQPLYQFALKKILAAMKKILYLFNNLVFIRS
jgi:hypothetical protein